MSKLAELEQSLSARPDVYHKMVEYFSQSVHTFHSVHLLVTPRSSVLSTYESLNTFMDELLKDHTDGRPHLSYPTMQDTLRLGNTEFDENISGVLSEVTTKTPILVDPELAENAMKAGALEVETEAKSTPLVRRIYVRPYPTVNMAGFVAAYENGIIAGAVRPDKRLLNLRREITLDQLAEVIKGKNPFPRIIRVQEGYYQNTPSQRAMGIDFLSSVRDFTDFGRFRFGTS